MTDTSDSPLPRFRSRLNRWVAFAQLNLSSLRGRTVLVAVITSVASLAILGTIVTLSAERDVHDSVGKQVHISTLNSAAEVDLKLTLVRKMLEELANRTSLAQLDSEEETEEFLRSNGAIYSLVSKVTMFRTDGSIAADWPVDLAARRTNYGDREWFQVVIKTGKPVMSQPFLGRQSGSPRVVMAAPVKGPDGTVGAIAMVTILALDPHMFGALTKKGFGRTGYLVMTDGNGTIISHPNPKRILTTLESASGKLAVEKARTGWSGYFQSTGTDGFARLHTAAPIGTTGWVLHGLMPVAEAHEAVQGLRGRMAGLSVALILLVVVVTWFLLGRILRPLSTLRGSVENMDLRSASVSQTSLPQRKTGISEIDAVASAIQDLLQRLANARAARERLAKIVESSADAIITRDQDFNVVTWNAAAERLFGYSAAEMIGSTSNVLIPAHLRSELEPKRKLSAQGHAVPLYDTQRLDKAGKLVDVSISQFPIADRDGLSTSVAVVYRDNTDRTRIQRELETSVQEKDTLLREIHHRVKNNLQIVSSLLNFQAKKLKNAEDAAVLREGQERLKSMILVHEKLYRAESLSRIEFGDYVRSLTAQLSDTYRATAGKVTLQVAVEPVYLPIEVALPCGMLLAELLTNAYKYAFPGERTGTLRVELQAQENQFRLVVQDDGVGLPEGMDPQSPEGFGLRLVANLAGQLGAELHFERGVGLGIFVVVPFTAHFAAPPLANRAERQAQ